MPHLSSEFALIPRTRSPSSTLPPAVPTRAAPAAAGARPLGAPVPAMAGEIDLRVSPQYGFNFRLGCLGCDLGCHLESSITANYLISQIKYLGRCLPENIYALGWKEEGRPMTLTLELS